MTQAALRFYSSVQVRELDRRAIASGITGAELMRRAAAACWRELTWRWPRARRLAVLCGPGNNGGDGYAIATLARDAGCEVRVHELSSRASGDAAEMRQAWVAGGGQSTSPGRAIEGAEVVVDALFGIGLSRAPDGAAAAAIRAANAARTAGAGVLAVDVPSGLDAERGVAAGEAVRADLTVTFIGRKPGLHTADGPDHAGEVVFDALGIAPHVFDGVPVLAHALDPAALREWLPRRQRTAHKGHFGHVLVVGGDAGMAGAALMCAQAALRAGAGLVSVATRAAHAGALTAAQPELMVHAVETPAGLRALAQRATVVAVGPGFGKGEWGAALWPHLADLAQPLVVDAEALHWLAQNPARREHWILTPHPGEAGALLGTDSRSVQSDRFGAAQALRERYGGTAVLKGAGTLVQDEALALCPHGNPGMAVGGMGDVLCGLIAGLRAQGLDAGIAARCGVLVHALAADRCAAAGERGLLPTDRARAVRSLLNPA